jgi:hypothetical protein
MAAPTHYRKEKQPAAFETAESRLRHAVIYREFRDVDSHVLAFCTEADRQLEQIPSGEARHKAVLRHVLDTLEWTRLMLCAARTACAAKLERAALIDRYLGTQTPDPQSLTRLDF